MIDFHCHLDLYPNPGRVLQDIVRQNHYVLAVTTTPLAWGGTCRLIGNSKRVRVALGLHPELVSKRYREVDTFCKLLPQAKFVGEIGLDGSKPHRSSLPLQQEVFRTILKATSNAGGRVMSIHSRGAASEVLDELEDCKKSGIPVMHWFSGTKKELARAIKVGCWFSVGPAMLRNAKGQKLIEAMPIDRILTETDGPFTRNGSEPLHPWDITEIEASLGLTWGTNKERTRQQLLNNFRRLVDLLPRKRASKYVSLRKGEQT